jgi:hypothetical protein
LKLGGLIGGLPDETWEETLARQQRDAFDMEGRGAILPYQKKNGKLSVALPGILAGMGNAATLPGRALQGEALPLEAMNFPLDVMGGSGLKGAIESFGGRKGFGRLVQAGLREAASLPLWDALQKRLDDGWEPTQEELNTIWKTHKLSLGHGDRKVRFEMDPSQTWVVGAALPQKSGEGVPFKSVVKNPEFEVAYPELFDQGKITMDPPGLDRGGSMASWRNEMTVAPNASSWTPTRLKQLVEHELTHYPERLEGFSPGGSADKALGGILTGKFDNLKAQQTLDAVNVWNKAKRRLTIPEVKEVEAAYPGIKIDDTTTVPDYARIVLNAEDHAGRDAIDLPVFKPFVDKIRKRAAVIAKTEELGNDAYFRLGGEQNANLAEHRVEMGPEARAIVPPATPLQTGGGMLHRRRNFYPAKDEYNLDAPGGGQKIQGAVVAALRAYAKDPTGHKAYYNRVIKGYGWDDMPAAAKSYKFTPDEHAELKSYIDTHLPKELKPYREYIEGLSMQNTEDWKPYSGPGSNWSEWAGTRLTAAKGTFHGIVDDAGSMLKDFGYKSPEPKGWSSGQLGMDAPGSPMNWDPLGKGTTPNHQEIDYLGFKRSMKPAEFLSKARRLSGSEKRGESLDFMRLAQKRGLPSVAPPQLYVEWDAANKQWLARGHEGRHRSTVAHETEPNTSVEVHIIPRDGLRARDITDEMRNAPIVGEDEVRHAEFMDYVRKNPLTDADKAAGRRYNENP